METSLSVINEAIKEQDLQWLQDNKKALTTFLQSEVKKVGMMDNFDKKGNVKNTVKFYGDVLDNVMTARPLLAPFNNFRPDATEANKVLALSDKSYTEAARKAAAALARVNQGLAEIQSHKDNEAENEKVLNYRRNKVNIEIEAGRRKPQTPEEYYNYILYIDSKEQEMQHDLAWIRRQENFIKSIPPEMLKQLAVYVKEKKGNN